MGVYAEWINVRQRRANKLWGRIFRVSKRIAVKLFYFAFGKLVARNLEAEWVERARFVEGICQARNNEKFQLSARPRIVHYIGSLQAGGAERQLCYCAIQQHRMGWEVVVLTLFGQEEAHSHYLELLLNEGIEVKVAGERFSSDFPSALMRYSGREEAARLVPFEFRPWTLDTMGELLVDPPDIFHSWLDHTNIWGGIGALLAGVPVVVLSTRNVNPSHFPYLAEPYFHAMYSQFVHCPHVLFINNSHAGAEDYAKWLGVGKEKFTVVLNGVDLSVSKRATEDEVAQLRNELSVPGEAQIIAGVFRLSEEKQPMVFLEVARRIVEKKAAVVFVIAGVGPEEAAMRKYISENGLDGRVLLLGRRSDIPTLFSAATIKLLCSRQEGTPNVLLEAQWLGCPVVTTRAGGAEDAISDGKTGFLVEVGDIDGIEGAVLKLLDDEGLRENMATQGPEFIASVFGVERMVEETNSVYSL